MPPSQRMLSSETNQYKNLILICLTLAILTVIAFWSLKDCGFINFDDDVYVYDNAYVQSGLNWNSIRQAFSSELVKKSNNWHPITWLSLMLDYELSDLNPRGYHLTNLFFHILNTILLFLIFYRMTKALWQSAIVAALFAIHPLHVESVAWVTERKDVLSTFFWMLSMGTYVFYTEKKSASRYLLVVFFFIIGLMSKTMLVTLPFVFILLDYWPLGRLKKTVSDWKTKGMQIQYLILEKIPLFTLVLVFSIIAYLAHGNNVAPIMPVPLVIRLENVVRSYIMYISKTIWPLNLAILYPFPENIALWQILGAVFILGIITCLILWKRKHFPFLLMGWLWYLGTLMPVIGIIQVGHQAYADRYTYIPLIGLLIMVIWGVPELLRHWRYRQEAIVTLSALSILGLSIITWTQVGYWQNNITLLEHALKVTDRNSMVYHGLGIAYNDLGDYGQAIEDFNRAIEIDPSLALFYCSRGVTYNNLGNYKQAIEDLDRAIEINTGFALAYYNRGVTYGRLGNYRHAIEDLDKAIEINPGFAEAYYNRGVTYGRLGNYNLAVEDLKTAVKFGHERAKNLLRRLGVS